MEKCGSPQMNRILTFSIPFQYTFARAAQCNYRIISYFTLLFYFIIIYYYIIIYFLLFLLLIITVVLVVKNV